MQPTILQTLEDKGLFAPFFEPPESWQNWRTALRAIFAIELSEPELEAFRKHTGRQEPLEEAAREAWLVVGRRGGKSRIAALIAVYLSVFRDYNDVLASGERAVVMCLASDRRQAAVVLGYIKGLLTRVPMLRRMIDRETREQIELTNRVTIEVHTCSYRAVRGYTIAACICDEVAFWRDDSTANPDVEVIRAIRPALSTVPNSLLLGISSPYARRGVLWEAYQDHFGKEDSPVLLWQAASREMNPLLPGELVEQAYEEDESAASGEYGAQFRRDIETFVPLEVVMDCVVSGRHELPPLEGQNYVAFCDPSGGARDSMTLAIAHHEDGRAVLDAIRERRPPFSPAALVNQFSNVLKTYKLWSVHGDRYAGEWPRDEFRQNGINYEPSARPKGEIYQQLLPALNSGRVELLEDRRLISQLVNLERRTSRGGRDSIDHRPGSHDDVANAAAGALLEAVQPAARVELW